MKKKSYSFTKKDTIWLLSFTINFLFIAAVLMSMPEIWALALVSAPYGDYLWPLLKLFIDLLSYYLNRLFIKKIGGPDKELTAMSPSQ